MLFELVILFVCVFQSSLTSRFLTDLGGDDGELSDEDEDDGARRSVRQPPATATAASATRSAATSGYASATSRIASLAVARPAAVKSYTAPVIASVSADDEEDEFDF